MSAKSKHGRGKHHRGKKKSKNRRLHAGAVLPQEATGNITRVDTPLSAAPAAKTQLQKKSVTSAALPLHYEFISSDLKRIGILTGIIVILLIVAYNIFS